MQLVCGPLMRTRWYKPRTYRWFSRLAVSSEDAIVVAMKGVYWCWYCFVFVRLTFQKVPVFLSLRTFSLQHLWYMCIDFPVKVFGKMKSVIATLRRQQQLLLLSKQTKRCIKNLSHPKSVVTSHSTLECCVCVCKCRSRPLHWHHVSIPLHTLNQRAYFCLMTTQIWVLHDEVT